MCFLYTKSFILPTGPYVTWTVQNDRSPQHME